MLRKPLISACELCGRSLVPRSRPRARRLHATPPTDPDTARPHAPPSATVPDEPEAGPSSAPSRLQLEQLRSRTREAFGRSRQDLEARLVELSSSFSRLTGYEQIEALKESVAATEGAVLEARAKAKEAKTTLENAIEARKTSQRESNDLLQRKSTWNEADVSRFTELVRRDHVCDTEEREARRVLQEREEEVERGFSSLMRAILARYHEEQVWSDKIRSMSTYGSLAITAANVLVFLLALVVVEPWRRRRLVEGVEARLHEREEINATRSEEQLVAVVDRLAVAEAKLDQTLARFAPSPASAPPSTVVGSPAMPDLGALLRDMMGEDEVLLADAGEQPGRGGWRDVVLAGAGGVVVGALAVAAALWR